MTALNLTPASDRNVEYILEAVQAYASEWKTFTMSSRNRDAYHAQCLNTLARIRTMLEDDARKLEASGRAALAQSPVSAQPRLVPDSECAQGHCGATTTGCWGECSLKRNQGSVLVNAVVVAAPVSAEGLSEAHRATIQSIASWLANSCQQVQLGPEEFGWQSEFDQQLAQASDELQFIISALDNQQAVQSAALVSTGGLVRDAARYRFLRKGFGDFGPDVDLHNAFVDGDEKMDAAIDAAIAAADKGTTS